MNVCLTWKFRKVVFFTGGSIELGEKERKCDPIVNAIEIKVQNKDINFLMTIVILLLTPAQLFSSRVKLSFFSTTFFGDISSCNWTFAWFDAAIIITSLLFSITKKMNESNISWWHHDSQPFLIQTFRIMSIRSFLYDHGDVGRALWTSRGESYSLIKHILPVMRCFLQYLRIKIPVEFVVFHNVHCISLNGFLICKYRSEEKP